MHAVACLGSSKSCSCSMVMFEEGEDAIYCNYIVESELATKIGEDASLAYCIRSGLLLASSKSAGPSLRPETRTCKIGEDGMDEDGRVGYIP